MFRQGASMSEGQSPEPPWARIESGDAVMLYDPSCGSNLASGATLQWFEPEYWRSRSAIAGSAAGRGSTLFIETEGISWALRHYHRGGLLARWLGDRYLDQGESTSRPLVEFHLTRRLRQAGLSVPLVVAARYQRVGRFYRGDLITERIADVRTLAMRMIDCDLRDEDWYSVGQLVARFHLVGLDHADLNAHNILHGADGRWWMIDFDRGRLRERGLWCDANLVRLRRSILKVGDRLPRVSFAEQDWSRLLSGYRDTLKAGSST
ncbi:MAG: 3-deoxy-D-manno-octulosonic acid kinase [Steroidobacteraceae bacterium]|jgi:3-deoxy-D-manno-octulosonic acid kinase